MRFLIKLVVICFALLVVVKICPWAEVEGPAPLIVAALLLGIFNTFVRPILIVFTLPINILTFGLFTFVINGIIIYAVSLIVPGFHLEGFFEAILTALFVSITSWLINLIIKDEKK